MTSPFLQLSQYLDSEKEINEVKVTNVLSCFILVGTALHLKGQCVANVFVAK